MCAVSFEDDDEAIEFLEGRGFVLLPSFYWKLPNSNHAITDDEDEALNYLFHEWDYGGVIGVDVNAD